MEVIVALKDIIDHLLAIKGIEWARIEGTSSACELGAMNKEAGIVVKVVMNEHIDGMIGTFGFFDFSHFKKILTSPGFDTPFTSVKFISPTSKDEPGNGILHFDNGAGQIYTESFYGKWFVDEKEKIPALRPCQFDVEFSPDQAGIDLLKYWHETLKDLNADAVEFFNKNGNVKCIYSFNSGQKYEFPFKNAAGAKF